MTQQSHAMQFVRTHPSGEDEFYCPACGRRLLLSWPPNYRKVVLEAGDEYATHTGARRDNHLLASLSAETSLGALPRYETCITFEASPSPVAEPPELAPWLRWMRAVGLAREEER